jgi:hypothetical protein
MTADKILKKYEDDNEYHFHTVDRKWIIEAMEQYAALRQPPVSGSYIRIEIVDYFGTKKVIEVKPYFDKQQLTEIEFLNAIRLLEEEKNKATYAFG